MTSQPTVERFDFFALTDFADPNGETSSFVAVEDITPEPTPIQETPPPPPPPKTFSKQELEQAKSASFQEGKIQGETEGREQSKAEDIAINSSLDNKIDQLNLQIQQLRDEYISLLNGRTDETTALAIHVAKLVAGETIKRQPEICIENMISECLPMLLTEPHITLTAHPMSAAKITDRLDNITDKLNYKGTLTVASNNQAEPTDCTLEWGNGKAEKSIDDIWQDISMRLLPEIWHSKALANGISTATTIETPHKEALPEDSLQSDLAEGTQPDNNDYKPTLNPSNGEL